MQHDYPRSNTITTTTTVTMKAAFVTLFAAGIVSAQNFDGVPECAVSCIEQSLSSVDCSSGDLEGCLCQEDTQAELQRVVAPCVLRECDPQEVIAAQGAAASNCAAYASASGSASASASGTETVTRTASDAGTTGLVSILPTEELPPVGGPVTPPGGTTISVLPTDVVTPPGGNGTTTATETETQTGTETTGGADSTNTDGSDGGDETDTPDAANSLQAAGALVAAFMAMAALL